MQERQAAQDYFLALLQTVIGQALDAAGYTLEQNPMQWAGGRYRFAKALEGGGAALIEFQALIYSDTAWSGGQDSRFQVQIGRSINRGNRGNRGASMQDSDPFAPRSLSQLILRDFGVKILPSEDHWWRYRDTDSLARALAEAGHLIVGYGLPWLAGELSPPSRQQNEQA